MQLIIVIPAKCVLHYSEIVSKSSPFPQVRNLYVEVVYSQSVISAKDTAEKLNEIT